MGNYRKKLIEVALPLDAINRESAREKSIRHGHPSTLHLWWARRPLAACRAVLFSSLVDDPDSDPQFAGDEKKAAQKRKELFQLIEELVKWENSNNPIIINRARAEIARCVCSQKIEDGEFEENDEVVSGALAKDILAMKAKPGAVNKFLETHAPPVLDPFAGGGSIPLEAQRLGLRAHASDINPVAVLINKALIEIPPKFAGRPPVNPDRYKDKFSRAHEWRGAQGLAEDVRYYGQWMRDEAEKRIGHLYPKVKVTQEMSDDGRPDLKQYVGQELTVIAWLWARTVASPNPAAKGAHVPLVRSFWLSKKKGKEAYVEPVVDVEGNGYGFVVKVGKPPTGTDPSKATLERTGGTCLITGTAIPFDHIRDEGKAGRMASRLMAIVCEGQGGRVYLPPCCIHEEVAFSASPHDYPETFLPEKALGFRVQLYGMDHHYKLFTPRQLVALTTFSDLVKEARMKVLEDHPDKDEEYANAVVTYLAFGVSKLADRASTISSWDSGYTKIRNTFGRQALPMSWDFAEGNPFCASTANWTSCIEWGAKCLDAWFSGVCCAVSQSDAVFAGYDTSCSLISTDPPYYDNIGYSDLADFFYIWLRRTIGEFYPDIFATLLTPKATELIASPYRHSNKKEAAKEFFEKGLSTVLISFSKCSIANYPTTIFYAFKQAEAEDAGGLISSTGWETFLDGLIKAGFIIVGTWPLRTELANRLVGSGTNALASSIILACRTKPTTIPLSSRREFLTALKQDLPIALQNLQSGAIAPVDLAQAAIGPGMAIFSKYSKVVESDGSSMTVRTALGLINQVLDEILESQESEFEADTRWAISWYSQYGHEKGPYGMAEQLSKAKNISVDGLVQAGILESGAGKVRLLKREELLEDWSPETDDRLTVWEMTQYLIRALENGGEYQAAKLAAKLGANAETARDLAYRLYSICDQKKWSKDAIPYNNLVVSWPSIMNRASELEVQPSSTAKQEQLL